MRQYVVDAFTDKVFGGNPAAVCILENWLPDELMMSITRENNLSETAFAVREGVVWRLRWFTPGGEIDLCGHATLATAYVLMNHVEPGLVGVRFATLSGKLTVNREGDMYELDFPAYELRPTPVTPEMTAAFGAEPSEAWLSRDLLCVFDSEDTVRALAPDMESEVVIGDRLSQLDGLLQHATSAGREFDCVSRSFAPKLSVPEDPVCGSGHCHIVPYWLKALGRERLTAYQASRRGGTLFCRMENGRVYMSGKAALYSVAELYV